MRYLAVLLPFLITVVLSANSYYYSKGEKVYFQKADKYFAFKTINKMEIDQVKAKILKIEGIGNIEKIKHSSKNIFVVKLSEKIENRTDFLKKVEKTDIVSYINPVYTFNQNKWPLVIDRKLVIKFKTTTPKSVRDFIVKNFKLTFIKRSLMDPNTQIFESSTLSLDIANKIFETGAVEYAQPDFFILHVKKFTPNDTYFQNQWHHEDGVGGVSSELAWDINQGSSSITIAVVDDGTDYNHEDLDIIDYQNYTYEDINIGGSHGTACSGVAAGKGNNGKGVSGLCMNCRLLSAKIMPEDEDAGYTSYTPDADAIQWVTNQGADVINNSWGFAQDFPVPEYLSDAIYYAANNGRGGKGAVVVFAAGNESREFSNNSLEGHPAIIAVGASNDSDNLSYYSNYGSRLDVVAPSNDGYYEKSIWTTDAYSDSGRDTRGYNQGGYYIGGGSDVDSAGKYSKYFGGTSSAAPLVSGLAGLILSEDSTLTYTQVRQVIRDTAEKIGSGYDSNGHSDYYGYGKINAYDALVMVSNGNQCEPTSDTEICGNGVDDDCDGAIDDEDSECGSSDVCDGIVCSDYYPNSYCVDNNGEPACTCNDGYVWGGTEQNPECVPEGNGCDNLDCAGQFPNSHCEIIDGEAGCVCDDGYSPNEEGTACVELSCDGVTCPENSSCQIVDGQMGCFCNEGYMVNETQDACIPIPDCADDNLGNNDFDTAYDASIPYTGTHHLCTDIADVFEIYLTTGDEVTITLDGFDPSSNDLDLYLLNQPEAVRDYVVGSSENGDVTEEIVYTAETTQSYYVLVSPYQVVDSDYTLTIDVAGVENPCEGVTCSGHGTCVNNNGTASCNCEAGYHAEGLNCIEDTVDPCEGVTCSNHGTCINNNGTAACSCDDGYHAEDLTCVENSVENPCEGVTCSSHGTCVNNDGTPSCNCEDGYTAEGLNCIENQSDPCDGVTCSGHGYCQVSGGTANCVCVNGYHAEGLTCIENSVENPCDGVTCSGHGTCVNSGGEATCSCEDGYSASALNCIQDTNTGGGSSSSGCSYGSTTSSNGSLFLLLFGALFIAIFRRKLKA